MKKILLTLVTIFLMSGYCFAQDKSFMTLTTLKQAGERIQFIISSNGGFTLEGVEETEGVEGYSGYTLTGSEVKIIGDIVEFSAPYVNIIEADITHMPGLTSFDVFGNPIMNIDLSSSNALKILSIGATEITSLDISKCVNLESLNINSSKISSLDLKQNNKLSVILAKNAGLKSLDLTGAEMLEVLDCSYNNLGTLDITKAPELNQLSCAGNNLETLDLSKHNMVVLNCNVNNLKTLDLSNQSNLEEFGCIGNKIERLDFSNCTSLFGLMLCSNSINHKEMTSLVGSLDKVQGAPGYFTVVDTNDGNEKNEMSVSNVEKAVAKNWEVFDYQGGMSGYDYGAAYEGIPDEQLSISEVCASDISIYKSVSGDMLYISGVKSGSLITVTDLTGAEVLSFTSDGSVNVINTSAMPEGIYIIKSGDVSFKFTNN